MEKPNEITIGCIESIGIADGVILREGVCRGQCRWEGREGRAIINEEGIMEMCLPVIRQELSETSPEALG